jgi:hypothetical protein
MSIVSVSLCGVRRLTRLGAFCLSGISFAAARFELIYINQLNLIKNSREPVVELRGPKWLAFRLPEISPLPGIDHTTTLCGVPATNPSMFFFSVSIVPLIVFELYQAI